jgi:hypothetical protein
MHNVAVSTSFQQLLTTKSSRALEGYKLQAKQQCPGQHGLTVMASVKVRVSSCSAFCAFICTAQQHTEQQRTPQHCSFSSPACYGYAQTHP